MPAVTIKTTPTLVYTSQTGTADNRDQFIFSFTDDTQNIAVITPLLGDDGYSDGVPIAAGQTFSVELVAGRKVWLVAETSQTSGTYAVI